MAISNNFQDIELPFNMNNFITFDDCFATHYNFESATDLLSVKNVEREEEEKKEA